MKSSRHCCKSHLCKVFMHACPGIKVSIKITLSLKPFLCFVVMLKKMLSNANDGDKFSINVANKMKRKLYVVRCLSRLKRETVGSDHKI